MKPNQKHAATLVMALLLSPGLRAEEPSPEIAGLESAASKFIQSYNARDAAGIAALFTEDGEMSDLKGEELISGRADIEAHYADVFADEDAPSVAVEVASVRIVAPTLAIEDGTVHYTPPGDDEPARSADYTAALLKGDDGEWKIASTRNLGDATSAAGHLADLAAGLKGDWTAMKDGMRLDLAFGWDDTGNYLAGEMLSTAADAPPQTTTIRFGWDGAHGTICCWTFDDEGGFAKATWTPDSTGWAVSTEGTTAGGESMSANQHLNFVDDNTIVWKVTRRLINGEPQPASELRVVRQTPEPSVE
ncbi:YybH family protein [Luteolibacter marinus]|uniref:YybH family protein n=1 Tax=Luteolibacter marinus TaxID=2776705 RepID=UPI001867FE20|nr:SgcJ/EcaC family oxidoreductase [Luteolibacter marinus]